MELREGYKQTEIGVFPVEWEVVPIGSLFIFKNGLNKAKQFFGYGTPIVNYMDVFSHSSLRILEIKGCVDVNSKELSAYNVRRGDVFFTRTSETVDEIGTASVMLDNPKKTVFSGFVLRARPTDTTLDDIFKAFCFTPRYFRQQVTARASYTTRALTNGRSLSAALLACPPVVEQRAIATALSDTDALLEGLDQLIAKKRDLKQATMQQLLTGKTRLPGFEEEWEEKSIADIAPLQRGFDLPNRYIRQGVVPIVYSNGVDKFHDTVMVKGPGVVTGRSGTLGKIHYIETDFWPHNTTLWVTSFNGNSPKFVFYLYDLIHFDRFASGSGVPTLNRNDAHSYCLKIPLCPDEQASIANILSDMDTEIEALQQRCTKTRDLKQAMMQELLTGKTRLISNREK